MNWLIAIAVAERKGKEILLFGVSSLGVGRAIVGMLTLFFYLFFFHLVSIVRSLFFSSSLRDNTRDMYIQGNGI